jgi:hypothetical protein
VIEYSAGEVKPAEICKTMIVKDKKSGKMIEFFERR